MSVVERFHKAQAAYDQKSPKSVQDFESAKEAAISAGYHVSTPQTGVKDAYIVQTGRALIDPAPQAPAGKAKPAAPRVAEQTESKGD